MVRLISLLTILSTFYLLSNAAFAQFSLQPNCNPTLPPSDTKGCGIPAFIGFIRNIIKQFFAIAIPLAVIFIIWGGFVIMTAGGSADKVRKGKEIITIAVIGLAITLGAWLILTAVNQLLQIKTGFQFK